MNNLQRALEDGQREDQAIQDKGWQKKSKGQSAAKLGAKHALKISIRRAIKEVMPGLGGGITSMIVIDMINKNTK